MTASRQRIDWAAVRRDLDRGQRALAVGFEPGPERRAEILNGRAAALAARRPRGGAVASSTAMLTFALAGERYALPLTALVAVIAGRSLGPVPGAPAGVVGTLYERAAIWMIHDLRLLLGLAGADASSPGFFLLLRDPGRRAGLWVESVGQVRRIDVNRLTALGSATAAAHPLVLGATNDALSVLDEARLRNHPALTEVT